VCPSLPGWRAQASGLPEARLELLGVARFAHSLHLADADAIRHHAEVVLTFVFVHCDATDPGLATAPAAPGAAVCDFCGDRADCGRCTLHKLQAGAEPEAEPRPDAPVPRWAALDEPGLSSSSAAVLAAVAAGRVYPAALVTAEEGQDPPPDFAAGAAATGARVRALLGASAVSDA
jgi:hypothetical protein